MDLAQLAILAGELALPAYSGLANQAAANVLNAVNVQTLRDRIETWEVIEATDPDEWTTLTAAEKQRYQTIVGAGVINPQGARTRSSFAKMFGAGTVTRTNLQALQNGPLVSRAAQLGLPFVGAHHVGAARGQ